MDELKFADSHNLAIFLVDPPAAHGELRSMVHGLKKCRLASALTLSPVIYQNQIKEFWSIVVVQKGDGNSKFVEGTVKGRKIVVTEQIIREVLRIEDQRSFLTEIAMDQTEEIIKQMRYEREFPPTIKKLLPPY